MTGRHGYPSEPPPLYHGSHTDIQLPPGRKEEKERRNGSTPMRGGGGDDDEYMTSTVCMHLSINILSLSL